MASTTYVISKVIDGELVEVDTKSKKATAVQIAEQVRGLERVAVQVATSAGTVVLELAAPSGKRVIVNRTKPWTRVDARTPELAEGVKLPKGYELTYLLPRNKMSVVRHPENLDYLVVDHLTGEQHPAGTCREASKIAQAIKAKRAALVSA